MTLAEWYDRLTEAEPGRLHFLAEEYDGGWYVGWLVSAWWRWAD